MQAFTKIYIFENFEQNRDSNSTLMTKKIIFEKDEKIQDFQQFFESVEKIEIAENYFRNRNVRKFQPKSRFSKIFMKMEVFQKF